MGDPAMTNCYTGLAYDIENNGLEDEAYGEMSRILVNIDKVPMGYIKGVLMTRNASCIIVYNN